MRMLPTERDSLWSEAGQSLLAGSSRHWEQPGLPLRELGMEAFPTPAPRLRCGWDKRGFGELQRSAIRILVPGKLSQDGVGRGCTALGASLLQLWSICNEEGRKLPFSSQM